MTEAVTYLHFGPQCPGYRYMEAGARGLAELLGCSFCSVDAELEPELAARHRMFFPGLIVVDGFAIPYPGTPQQLLESYRRRGPIPGAYTYMPPPPTQPSCVRPLLPQDIGMATVCLREPSREGVAAKSSWLAAKAAQAPGGCVGFVAYAGGTSAATLELLPESLIPYPVPDKRPTGAFITCLYGREGAPDYRGALLDAAVERLPALGYTRLTAVSGLKTPYPNGPLDLFRAHGFTVEVPDLGEVLLRHTFDRMCLVRRELSAARRQ